jgi:hypothetical protein
VNGGTRENEGGRHRARAISNDGVKGVSGGGGGRDQQLFMSRSAEMDDWKFVSSLGRLVVFRISLCFYHSHD